MVLLNPDMASKNVMGWMVSEVQTNVSVAEVMILIQNEIMLHISTLPSLDWTPCEPICTYTRSPLRVQTLVWMVCCC